MTPISLSLQNLYAELLDAHLAQPHGEVMGAPFKRDINGSTHWYANMRGPNGQPIQRYIGPDTPHIHDTVLPGLTASRTDRKAFETTAKQHVAALRQAGALALDITSGSLLNNFAKAGVFRLGGVLVGTHAFRLYGLILGVNWRTQDIGVTGDVDVASFTKLSVALEDAAEPSLPDILSGLNYETAPSLTPQTPTSWRKKTGTPFTVDFITPAMKEEQRPEQLPTLDVWAQGLHFLNFLIRDPMPAVALYREGVLVQIPTPERYAIHKLIVSQRRPASATVKVRKDLRQAEMLITTLAELRPYELTQIYHSARHEGPKWAKALDSALSARPQLLEILDAE